MVLQKVQGFFRTLLFICFLLSLTVAVALSSLFIAPFSLLRQKGDLGVFARQCIWWYGKLYTYFMQAFTPSKLSWEDNLPYDIPKSSILVMNHFSILDLYYLGLLPKEGNIVFVTEKRPFLVKLYAPFMAAAEYIDMRTTDLDECAELCTAHLEKGNRILFFPEGRRSRDGKIGSFKSLPFYIALQHRVPIIPLCISGTEKILPSGAKNIRFAPVHLHILQAVDTSAFMTQTLPHRALKKEVQGRMTVTVQRLQSEQEEILP